MKGNAGSFLTIGAALFAIISMMFLSRQFAAVLVGFAGGVLLCTYFPGVEKLVGAAGGWVRSAVGGKRPAPAAPARAAAMYAVPPAPPPEATPARPKVDWATGTANIGRAFVAFLNWCIKNPQLVMIILIVAFVWFCGGAVMNVAKGLCPFCFPASAEVRADRSEANKQAAQHETHVGAEALRRAEHTHAVETRVAHAVSIGQQDIADAIAHLPPHVTEAHFGELDRRYVDAYDRVWNATVDDHADPGAAGGGAMRAPSGHSA